MELSFSPKQKLVGAHAEMALMTPSGAGGIRFRYDPVLRSDAEFVLWYRPALCCGEKVTAGGNYSVRFQWFADEDRPLTANSEPEQLDLSVSGLWRPLRIDVPLSPRNCDFLRFEAAVAYGPYVYTCSGRLWTDTFPEFQGTNAGEYGKLQPGQSDPSGVTAVVTSCGRQDLLEGTLDTFFRFNSFRLTDLIVVEDGPASANHRLANKYLNKNIRWLATGKKMGQIVAIDYAYSFINSEFIFHLEDDWEFWRSGFVEKSLSLLQSLPNCLQVYIRAVDDINGHPLAPGLHQAGGQSYRRVEFGYINAWHGFSFNPGLRRTADYRRLGGYGKHVRHDRDRPGNAEARLSRIYRDLGLYAVILAGDAGAGYVRHTGDGRRVE